MSPDLPPDLAAVGQPVLLPRSMGTASHVLVGAAGGGAFHSTCHGAARAMSRTAARKRISGRALRQEFESAGVAVRAGSNRGLADEAPFSYKERRCGCRRREHAGLARRVARLVPSRAEGLSDGIAAAGGESSAIASVILPLLEK